MTSTSNIITLILGIILSTSTMFFIGNEFIIFYILISIIFLKVKLIKTDLILLIFIIICSFSSLFFLNKIESLGVEGNISFVLMIFTIIASRSLNSGVAYIFFLVISLEALIGSAQFYMGVTHFFSDQVKNYNFQNNFETDILMNKRVMGLRENSSVFSYNILLAIILFYYYKFYEKNINKFLLLLLITGLFVSFNRSTIMSLFLFFIFVNIKNISKNIFKFKSLVLYIVFSFIILYYKDEITDQVTYQFLRGGSNLDTSTLTRLTYAQTAFDFIKEHPFFGNGAIKYYVFDSNRNIEIHAHNSYLMLIATYGIFPSSLIITYIIIEFSKNSLRSILCIICIMIYSISQYGIFWNISVMDIVFYHFLFSYKKCKNA